MRQYVGYLLVFVLLGLGRSGAEAQEDLDNQRLSFKAVTPLPDELGVTGPIVGVVGDSLIVAGGANFAAADDPQLWDLPKKYHRKVWVLDRTETNGDATFAWNENV